MRSISSLKSVTGLRHVQLPLKMLPKRGDIQAKIKLLEGKTILTYINFKLDEKSLKSTVDSTTNLAQQHF